MKLPMQSDGQLSLHVLLNCSTGAPCPTEQLPVRVLDPIQSIGLRTDKSFYQPQDIGNDICCLLFDISKPFGSFPLQPNRVKWSLDVVVIC